MKKWARLTASSRDEIRRRLPFDVLRSRRRFPCTVKRRGSDQAWLFTSLFIYLYNFSRGDRGRMGSLGLFESDFISKLRPGGVLEVAFVFVLALRARRGLWGWISGSFQVRAHNSRSFKYQFLRRIYRYDCTCCLDHNPKMEMFSVWSGRIWRWAMSDVSQYGSMALLQCHALRGEIPVPISCRKGKMYLGIVR